MQPKDYVEDSWPDDEPPDQSAWHAAESIKAASEKNSFSPVEAFFLKSAIKILEERT